VDPHRIAPHRRAGRRAARQGFILTLTLILVFTIVVIGSFVGLAALRNALLVESGENVIFDSAATPIAFGRAKTFDLCEAPQLVCKDPDNGLLPIVGVRPTRFTSRNQVFYSAADCTGDVYLAPPAVPGAGVWQPELPVGYLNGSLLVDGTPDRVAYGVGGPEPGLLYRSTTSTAASVSIASVWTSLAPDCAPEDLPGTATPPTALCENIGPLNLNVVEAGEVEIAANTNVLEQYTAPFYIEPSTLEYSPAADEDAVLQMPTIATPGSPVAFPDPEDEDAAPLAEDAAGASGAGDPLSQPAPGDEDDPPPP